MITKTQTPVKDFIIASVTTLLETCTFISCYIIFESFTLNAFDDFVLEIKFGNGVQCKSENKQ